MGSVVHFDIGNRRGRFHWPACGVHDHNPDKRLGSTKQGSEVTCLRCRRTGQWQKSKLLACHTHRKVLHALTRDTAPWGRNRERVQALMGETSRGIHDRSVWVALDRYEEQDPADRDPAALAMELAPVDPGWWDEVRVGWTRSKGAPKPRFVRPLN